MPQPRHRRLMWKWCSFPEVVFPDKAQQVLWSLEFSRAANQISEKPLSCFLRVMYVKVHHSVRYGLAQIPTYGP